jgi:hypothetical protein
MDTVIKKVEAFLLGILPYLLIKKEQAVTALEYVRMTGVENPERRNELWEKMKSLHQYADDVESPTTNMSNIKSAIEVAKTESRLAGLPEPAVDMMKIESELHSDMQSVQGGMIDKN